jgi:hypothetical protein
MVTTGGGEANVLDNKVVAVDLAEAQKKNIENTIVITGAGRSGTSVLGRLISTLNAVKYHYEPPMVWMLAGLLSMKVLEPSVAEWLLRYYLHEELLCESASGRRANLRPMDESLVLNAIPWHELISRMVSVRTRNDAIRLILEKKLRLAIKSPSIIDAVPFIAGALPKAQFIVIVRRGHDVVRSVLNKGWLSDEGLQNNYYPYKVVGGIRIPHLVEDELAGKWLRWDAVTRACYMWRRDAEFARPLLSGEFKRRVHFVSYEKLVVSPEDVMSGVSTFLLAEPTDLTRTTMMSVRPPKEASGSGCTANLFDSVDKEQLRLFNEANAAWQYT